MVLLRALRAGPLVTLQDAGRPGYLRYGVSAAGPMDQEAFVRAGEWLGGAGATGFEFTSAGLSFAIEDGSVGAAWDGGAFAIKVDGRAGSWPGRAVLKAGTVVDLTPGEVGNYGYLRFDREIELPAVMGSRATSSIAGLGGLGGRALVAGDVLRFGAAVERGLSQHPHPQEVSKGPIRVTWGIHADAFTSETRQRFVAESFGVTTRLDRMGVRLSDEGGVFAGRQFLSLVSDAIVPGDIQILGDGTPIVLMRDHQPTGGYPRIATIVTADLDRFAQLRPGTPVRFAPVTVAHAQESKG